MHDASLDDAFRRLAAKNQLSHCSKRKRNDAHNDSQHTVTASRANNTQTSRLSENLSNTLPTCEAQLKNSIAHCSLSLLEWRRWRPWRLLARQLDNALGCERLRSVSSATLNCRRTGIEARRLRPWLLRLSTTDDVHAEQRRRAAAAVARRRGRLGRGAAKDGAEARRNGAGARASALSGASTASLSMALAAAELLGSQRFESAVSCASSNGSPKEAVDLGVRRKNVLAALAAAHAAQHVGLAALLVQVEQARIVKRRSRPLRARSAAAARIAAEFDLGLQSWSSSA